jgi:hypothetical protein
MAWYFRAFLLGFANDAPFSGRGADAVSATKLVSTR